MDNEREIADLIDLYPLQVVGKREIRLKIPDSMTVHGNSKSLRGYSTASCYENKTT